VLKQAQFTNYRCLRSVSIDFGPLTVLVGPNACGKTTVLKGIQPLQELCAEDAWHHSRQPVAVELLAEGGARLKKEWSQGRSSGAGRKWFSGQLLHLDLNALRSENKLQESQVLQVSGANLTNVFATLPRRLQDEVAQRFATLAPMFADVNARPTNDGHHRLVFQDKWDANTWYTPHEVSDGTMLLFAYLTVLYQQPQVDLVAIEEPERGLHPYLLGELVSVLRKMASGKLGSKSVQVVLATHSAELLDHRGGHQLAGREEVLGAVGVVGAVEAEALELGDRLEHPHRLGGHLGADPIAAEDRDLVCD